MRTLQSLLGILGILVVCGEPEESVLLQLREGMGTMGTMGMEGKHQVLIPKPLRHEKGDVEIDLTAKKLRILRGAAQAAGEETFLIVEAQLLSRLPRVSRRFDPSKFTVVFLHQLHENVHWQPIRERNESYALEVRPEGITVDASSSWALANAMSTLYQLLAVEVAPNEVAIRIPGCPHTIEDQAAFVHRGFLLDVSRQWYSLQWIKSLVHALAEFKINVLHLHLTDTASWPLEVDGYPQVARELSYRDNNGTYSRAGIRDLVRFAELRGMAIMPEIDGPTHAPALGDRFFFPLTVAATAKFSTEQFAYEPPPGMWNISDPRAMDFVRTALQQVEEDFRTLPFLHLGGDEPVAASLCVLLPDLERKACWEQCPTPWSTGCSAVPVKPKDANETYWFPEFLNTKVQDYFDSVDPSPAKVPRAAWSGAVADCGVTLPPTQLKAKSALQLWEFPAEDSGANSLSEEDCETYDLLQSAATYTEDSTTYGWLYMDCGSGANWISMGPDYWCPRASWAALYSLNVTQGYGKIRSPACQKAFLGGEMALWSEIGGMGNAMSLIFPRVVAFAERMWSNPPGLTTEEMTGGTPPKWYWEAHLREAMERLNTVVANFDMLQLPVSHLQPEFCRTHPEYCNAYTASLY